MRLRTFTATDMPTAMKMVREALGDGAIILASTSRGKNGVSVTAAVEGKTEEDTPIRSSTTSKTTPPRNTPEIDSLRFEIQNILRFHNVPDLFSAKIMQRATTETLHSILALHQVSAHRNDKQLYKTALEKLLENYFMFEPVGFKANGRTMLVGPPGVGKTLTIARIAAQFSMEKRPLAVITTDNKRAGGVEQLQAFTTILNAPLQVADTPSELWKQLQAVPAGTHVLIDTSGCNAYDKEELHELKSYIAADGIEPILVLPAGGDSLEAIDLAESFVSALPIRRLLVTRSDTARRFGGILAAGAACGLAFCDTTGSSSIINTLQPVDAASLAHLLLRYQLQTH